MGQAILFTAGKGGSGTTTFTINTGVILANSGAKVLIWDMNIGLRNDDIYLGLEDSILFDLGDVISGTCSLDKAIIPSDTEGLFLLPCSQCKGIPGFSQSHIMNLMITLKEEFDYVLIDCPVNVGKTLEFLAGDCDKAVLVVTPDYVSIRNTDAVSRRLEAVTSIDKLIAINRVSEKGMSELPNPEWILRSIALPIVGVVAEDEAINISNNNGVPIVCSGSGPVVKTFIEITARIVS